jgi:nicotinamidase-related amidase
MMKALLVIDMLKDFILPDGKLSVGSAGMAIVPHIHRAMEKSRQLGEQLIFICDSHRADDAEFEIFPPHCIGRSGGDEIIDELSPQETDLVIYKRRYSAFFATELDLTLRELGVTELTLTGVCTNICVLYTAADARNLGYRVNVIREAVTSFDQDAHDFALAELEKTLGVTIISSASQGR